jgi:muramoyltetrapeptide carboxypeptidase
LRYLRAQGFTVRVGQSVTAELGYLAGSDQVRLSDLHRMFGDASVHGIICLRGGYGSARLLDDIDYGLLRRNPKVLIGFSDVTALHCAMLTRAGLLSFAGPMAAVEMASGILPATSRMMWEMLMKQRKRTVVSFGEDARVIGRGAVEGQLIGGNLAVLTSLLGTRYMPDMHGAVLFLEEVGEQVYRIDRLLLQLRQSGVLGAVAGIALGSFTSIPAERRARALDDVFDEYLAPLGIPVVTGLPFGHIATKATLPVGARVRLDATRRRLTVLQQVVR